MVSVGTLHIGTDVFRAERLIAARIVIGQRIEEEAGESDDRPGRHAALVVLSTVAIPVAIAISVPVSIAILIPFGVAIRATVGVVRAGSGTNDNRALSRNL